MRARKVKGLSARFQVVGEKVVAGTNDYEKEAKEEESKELG